MGDAGYVLELGDPLRVSDGGRGEGVSEAMLRWGEVGAYSLLRL